jgi:hypothetical protein
VKFEPAEVKPNIYWLIEESYFVINTGLTPSKDPFISIFTPFEEIMRMGRGVL